MEVDENERFYQIKLSDQLVSELLAMVRSASVA